MKTTLFLGSLLASTASAATFLVEMNCGNNIINKCSPYDTNHLIMMAKQCIPMDMLKHGKELQYDVNSERLRVIRPGYVRDTTYDEVIGKCCRQDCSLVDDDSCIDYCITFNDPFGKRSLRGSDELESLVENGRIRRKLILDEFEECKIWIENLQRKGQPLSPECTEAMATCEMELITENGCDDEGEA